MSKPSGPDDQARAGDDETVRAESVDPTPATEAIPSAQEPSHGDDHATTAIPEVSTDSASTDDQADETVERRFTAPSGYDAGATEIIQKTADPATEVFPTAQPTAAPTLGTPATPVTEPIATTATAAPQVIPGRGTAPKPKKKRSWGWVIAVLLVIAAIIAVAILGTLILTRDDTPAVSQEEMVKTTIQNFDSAIQKGDLATLRSITCGDTAESYIRYDDKQWNAIHSRVAAARQYPVVASIDQVVVNDKHAEANVTTFMAFDPATQSTRSFDLEFRDDQWKICQAPQ